MSLTLTPIILSALLLLSAVDCLLVLVGKLRPARCVRAAGEKGPAQRALPDLVLGHKVHALCGRGAERFLRHGSRGLRKPKPVCSCLRLCVLSCSPVAGRPWNGVTRTLEAEAEAGHTAGEAGP